MVYHFTYRHMQGSEQLNSYAQSHITKIFKFDHRPIKEVHFVFRALEHGDFFAELVLRGSDQRYMARASGENFFEAVDKVIERVGRQMARKKSRLIRARGERVAWDDNGLHSDNSTHGANGRTKNRLRNRMVPTRKAG